MPESQRHDPRRDVPRFALRVTDAALALGVSPRTIATLRESGQLRSFTVGRRVLISTAEIHRFIRERMAEAGDQ